jgi:hypothetical protein
MVRSVANFGLSARPSSPLWPLALTLGMPATGAETLPACVTIRSAAGFFSVTSIRPSGMNAIAHG